MLPQHSTHGISLHRSWYVVGLVTKGSTAYIISSTCFPHTGVHGVRSLCRVCTTAKPTLQRK
jgi:hypothetical protein